jgi:hypothetical protein
MVVVAAAAVVVSAHAVWSVLNAIDASWWWSCWIQSVSEWAMVVVTMRLKCETEFIYSFYMSEKNVNDPLLHGRAHAKKGGVEGIFVGESLQVKPWLRCEIIYLHRGRSIHASSAPLVMQMYYSSPLSRRSGGFLFLYMHTMSGYFQS